MNSTNNSITDSNSSKNRLMLDLETLGVGQKPIICSIGAVVFNLESRSIVDRLHITIDCSDAQRQGLELEIEAVIFWLEQSKEAINSTFFSETKHSLKDALINLNSFFLNHNCEAIYGNGALSDLVWIKAAYEACKIKPSWTFREERCYRTLIKDLPKLETPENTSKHNALADAEWQANYLIELSKIVPFR